MTPPIWLVTGASRGLGRAITEHALAQGCTVVATVRGEHDLAPHDALHVRTLDVRDRGAARAEVAWARERFGRLDVVVNNAGYGLVGAVEEVAESEARELLDVDLLGPLWLSQAAAAAMREQRAGHLVQISTVGAVGAMPTLGLYNAAKWGLEGFSEALAGELAPFGVRVTLVQPGAIDTEWATGSMRFSAPIEAYDDQRRALFGTAEVPWPGTPGATGGGTSPADAAAAIWAHVADHADTRRRLLVGDDAVEQVSAVMAARLADYGLDPRFVVPG